MYVCMPKGNGSGQRNAAEMTCKWLLARQYAPRGLPPCSKVSQTPGPAALTVWSTSARLCSESVCSRCSACATQRAPPNKSIDATRSGTAWFSVRASGSDKVQEFWWDADSSKTGAREAVEDIISAGNLTANNALPSCFPEGAKVESACAWSGYISRYIERFL